MLKLRLVVGDVGDDVARLHDALKLHGIEVSTEEQKRKFFGPSTRTAVHEFQKTHGINPTCEVCEKTAALLIGTAQRALASTAEELAAPVSTRQQSASAVELPGVIVSTVRNHPADRREETRDLTLRHRAIGRDARLVRHEYQGMALWYGTDDTPAPGPVASPEASVTIAVYPVDPANHVEVRFRVNGGPIRSVSATPLSARPGEYFTTHFPDLHPGDVVRFLAVCHRGAHWVPSPEDQRRLEDDDPTPESIPNWPVSEFVVNRAGPALQVPPDAAPLLFPERSVREHLIGGGPTAAAIHDVLSVGLAGDLATMLRGTDHARVADLLPELRDVDLATDQALTVGAFIEARLLASAETDPTLTEAIRSAAAGLPRDRTVGDVLSLSLPLGKHPALREIVAGYRLATLAALAATSPAAGEETKRRKFLTAYTRHEAPEEEFWERLARDPEFGPDGAADLRFTLRLGELTDNHISLVKALQELRRQKEVREYQDLAAFAPDRWAALLERGVDGRPVGVPPGTPGSTRTEQAERYVSGIVAALEAEFPTPSLARAAAAPPAVDLTLIRRLKARNPGLSLRAAGSTAADFERMDWSGFDVAERVRVRETLEALGRETRMFPGLDVRRAFETDGPVLRNPVREAVARFFANAPKFDLRRTPLRPYLAVHPGTLGNIEPSLHSPVIEYVSAAQRLVRITPRPSQILTLLGEGFRSARSIAAVPVRDFITRLAPALGGAERAAALHARSAYLDAAIANVALNGVRALQDDVPMVIGQKLRSLKEIPNLVTLFGSLDFCGCPHCQSLFGPAAYLVDLLNFLGKCPPNADKFTPLDVLIGVIGDPGLPGRRPDLEYVRLTCENSNTPLPYIDLVNEILESYVVYRSSLAHTSEPYKPRPNDTSPDATADELGVNPEHTLQDAYKPLYEAVYPDRLPFDPSVAVARNYLEFQGTSLAELMRTFQTADPNDPSKLTPPTVDVACEVLQITPTERRILNGSNPAQPWAYYGYGREDVTCPDYAARCLGREDAAPKTVPWATALSAVPELLGRCGIDHADLMELCRTRFVNPQGTLKIARVSAPPDGGDRVTACDLNCLVVQNLDDAALGRLHKFVRLWRKLGWSIRDIDRVLPVLGETTLTDAALIKLMGVGRLRDELRLPLPALLAFWSDIDTWWPGAGEVDAPDDSLYTRLFQNKAVLNPVDPAFALDPTRTKLAVEDAKLADHVAAILAALRITAADLAALIEAKPPLPGLPTEADVMTLANLSALFRFATLAAALQLRVPELVTLTRLAFARPGYPFNDPDETAAFVAVAHKVRASDFTAAELDYLFRDVQPAGGGVALPQESSEAVFASLRESLRGVAVANAADADPDGSLLRDRLVAVLNTDRVGEAMEIIARTTALPRAKQEAFIDEYFKPFLDPDAAKIALLDSPALTTADRYAYVLTRLGAYLRTSQGEAVVIQTLGDDLKLEAATARLLLAKLIQSQTEPVRPALKELLAVIGDGLVASYFDNVTPAGTPVLTRVDPAIDFDWGKRSPAPGVPATGFSVRWEGKVLADRDEMHTFHVRSAGAVRLWVGNGSALLDRPATAAPAEAAGTKALKAGQFYDLRLELTAAASPVGIQLRWSSRSLRKSLVAQAELYSVPGFSFDRARECYRLLHKAALVIGKFRLTPRELEHLSANEAHFGGFDLNALPVLYDPPGTDADAVPLFGWWLRLCDIVQLREGLPGGDVGLVDVWAKAAANAADPESKQLSETTVSALEAATGWPASEVKALAGPNGFALTDASLADELQLLRLRDALALTRRLGILASQAFTWAKLHALEADAAASVAEDIQSALKARYDEQTWLAVARPLNDSLREVRRSALVAYLLTAPEIRSAGVTDASGLYEFLLIDVDMAACMMTSRIKQAISSVQLFVQRCLMNLEPGISPGAIPADRWEWMKHYRVWEANRKVFLYAENWIEPELRRDKSLLFEEFESELMQNDLTAETAEVAFRHYLEKLEELAHLEVRGVYRHQESESGPGRGDGSDTLHVFARTPNKPHAYFYRRWIDRAFWTPWEPVRLDIEGNALAPVVLNRKLYLFWAALRTTADPADNTPQANAPPGTANKRLEVTLAWSRYEQGVWSAKEISDPMLTDFGFLQEKDYGSFSLRFDNHGQYMAVQWYYETFLHKDAQRLEVGQFRFPSCRGRVDTYLSPKNYVQPAMTTPFWTRPQGSVFTRRDDLLPPNTSLYLATDPLQSVPVIPDLNQPGPYVKYLDRTDGRFGVLFPHASLQFTLKEPFFFQDERRVFFVTPPAADLQFAPFYHPFACELMKALNRGGVPGVLTLANQALGLPYLSSPWFRYSGDVPDMATDQPVFIGYGNIEVLVRQEAKLAHFTRAPHPDRWSFAGYVTQNAAGRGAIFQTDSGNPEVEGNFHVVVPEPNAGGGRTLVHYVRNNADVNKPWLRGREITTAADGDACLLRLLSSRGGQLIALVVESGELVAYAQRLWYDAQSSAREPWTRSPIPRYSEVDGSELVTVPITGAPSAVRRSDRDMLDLALLEGKQLVHYTADATANVGSSLHRIERRQVITSVATGPGCITGSDMATRTFLGEPYTDLEVVALEGNELVHYWNDDPLFDSPWHRGQTVSRVARKGGWILQTTIGLEVIVLEEAGRLANYRQSPNRFLFVKEYGAQRSVRDPYPLEDIDFRYGGAYALYNWELFFHAPLLIATRLSENQRFEEAQQWFHFIFNPTNDSPDQAPRRYWNLLPFYLSDPSSGQVGELLRALRAPTDPGAAGARDQVAQWAAHPFDPHLVARMRPMAYQKAVVMKYLDNLLAWGDQLFARDTLESINEATHLYILALKILGPRPTRLPAQRVAARTFHDLRDKLDDLANALETELLPPRDPPDETEADTPTVTPHAGLGSGLGLGMAFYFCIPPNDRLLNYWDTVADRLYKIRHCMNIEGVVRQLALFEPPIDPALLVQAVAGGSDIRSAVADMDSPTPYYRFSFLLQKALELCGDVKALGASLLAALEKGDAEQMALLRATQETQLLTAVRLVKEKQVDEARETLNGLHRGKDVVASRRDYYRNIARINPNEQLHLNSLNIAHVLSQAAQDTRLGVAAAHLIPNFSFGSAGMSSPVVTVSFGGDNLGSGLEAAAQVFQMMAAQYGHDAAVASIKGGYDRRWDDWKLQERLANKELDQIDRQIAAANVRLGIATQELTNHDKQAAQAGEIEAELRRKFTNLDLYRWMVARVSGLYFQAYQLAYALAKRAEKAYRFERGLTESDFIRFGHWDSLKKGLLAGEALYLALKGMDRAYLDQNKREYEITKQISLVLLDPLALIALKETGRCHVRLPEQLFDADYPGHYHRRVKSVGLTIPCVVGPYTGVNCTLTLLSSKVRVNPNSQAGYLEQEGEDPRFVYNFVPAQSIVTSTAQNDAGLFELSFRDERFLPFEGAGVVSDWRIELPPDTNAFDLSTVSDVILRLSYTAREGGEALRNAARAVVFLPAPVTQSSYSAPAPMPDQTELFRLFSARHEFPGEWHRFLNPPDTAVAQTLELDLTPERFPLLFRGRTVEIDRVELFFKFKSEASTKAYREKGKALKLTVTPPGGSGVTQALDSVMTFMNGVPHGVVQTGGAGLGRWTFRADDGSDPNHADGSILQIAPELRRAVTENNVSHARLKTDTILDFFIVVHYAAKR